MENAAWVPLAAALLGAAMGGHSHPGFGGGRRQVTSASSPPPHSACAVSPRPPIQLDVPWRQRPLAGRGRTLAAYSSGRVHSRAGRP
jgi:hypothetical protein